MVRLVIQHLLIANVDTSFCAIVCFDQIKVLSLEGSPHLLVWCSGLTKPYQWWTRLVIFLIANRVAPGCGQLPGPLIMMGRPNYLHSSNVITPAPATNWSNLGHQQRASAACCSWFCCLEHHCMPSSVHRSNFCIKWRLNLVGRGLYENAVRRCYGTSSETHRGGWIHHSSLKYLVSNDQNL